MKNNYKKCLDYIENFWKEITYYFPEDKTIHIGLPNQFVAPNTDMFKEDQFYWDSYFIILGLLESNRTALAKAMVDNFVYLYNKFRIIPSRNRFHNLGISQPPFLTSMVLEIFKITRDKQWLTKTAEIAEIELRDYWMDKKHLICKGLSRYCDHYITHLTSEHESGWDMTSRFNDKALNYLPVDLNTLLYKYETDLAEIYKILKDKEKKKYYSEQAKKRKQNIMELMWNDSFFFDYNYQQKKQSSFYSIAGFYPLWAKLVTKKQAEKIKDNLKLFEQKGGLANTQAENLLSEFRQHDYPNGWAHQQWIVIKGLLNYGFKEDAQRLAKKWLNLNRDAFTKTGKFWEKYNVVDCDIGEPGRYPTQDGFGWTNAVFVKLIKELFK